jgi:hypothetical protein
LKAVEPAVVFLLRKEVLCGRLLLVFRLLGIVSRKNLDEADVAGGGFSERARVKTSFWAHRAAAHLYAVGCVAQGGEREVVLGTPLARYIDKGHLHPNE